MSINTVRSFSDKEWQRAMEKYPIGSPATKLVASQTYDTADANFPRQDSFGDIVPKQDINLDSALKEIKDVIRPSPEKVKEAKKMLNNFKDKVAKYPTRISYEGSMVLCVLLSLSPKATSVITGLPAEDQKLITDILPEKYLAQCDIFEVKFDDQKDFVLIFTATDELTQQESTYELRVFNTIIHSTTGVDRNVPIEKEGEKIVLGSTIVLDTKRIQKLVGVDRFSALSPSVKTSDEEEVIAPRRQTVSGRNAFEIREDILECAINLLFHNNKGNIPPEEVVKTAKVLYAFVENRR